MDSPTFFDVVYTSRAIRRIKPDPVPTELVHMVLESATMAPSGTNRQPWRFVVVTDSVTKRRLGEYHTKGFAAYYGGGELMAGPILGGASTDEHRPQEPGGITEQQMIDRYANVPVLIVVCHAGDGPAVDSFDRGLNYGGSTYPAIQNLLLAARALGLGAHITSLFRACRREVKELLEMPDEAEPIAMIPLGFPTGRFGPLRRRPVDEVSFAERWGQPWKP